MRSSVSSQTTSEPTGGLCICPRCGEELELHVPSNRSRPVIFCQACTWWSLL